MEPKVTLAILTYNQERYVKRAIESALAQDYNNLEILISDDASTDQTYNVILKTISNYSGPHTIKINRNFENLGTLAHFFRVIDLAEGELLLLNAGDDLSISERVSLTVKEWNKKNFFALFSDYIMIGENEEVLLPHYIPSTVSTTIKEIFGKENAYEMHGASSAYNLEFLRKLPRPNGHYLFEDAFMTFMLYYHSKDIVKLDIPFVLYRQHADSVSNNGGFKGNFKEIYEKQYTVAKVIRRRYELSEYLLCYGNKKNINRKFNSIAYSKMMKNFKIKSEWIELTVLQRVLLIIKYRKDKKIIRWLIPRVFGVGFFTLIYFLRNKLK